MRSLGKFLGRLLLGLIVLAVAAWVLLPTEPVDRDIAFDAADLGDDLDAYFAAAEARFDDIVPGTEKRVIWADAPGQATPLTLVYLHGFSASAAEVRPLPDLVAERLGANLIYTRLTGHGRDGPAMAEATAGDWIEDTAEALAAARAIGDRVVVIATSTGGTLAALAATDPILSEALAGIVLISPNFRVANPSARLLTWPGARWWVPWIAGAERGFKTINADQARYWTERYPTVAVLPMAALVRHVRRLDFGDTRVPALFLFAPEDAVVDAGATERVAARWGGPATVARQNVPPGNDPYRHVIAGDILSPDMTAPLARTIQDWIVDLPQ